jgi:streptomycin 6-kinase
MTQRPGDGDRRRGTLAVSPIRIPPQLADAVDEDDYPARLEWLAALPTQVMEIASAWELELGDPYLPGGQCAWVAPARNPAGDELVLKVGWRHREAEHEADGLRHWDGDGAIRCFAARHLENTTALLLERCTPGRQLGTSAPETKQDEIIARLLLRLWARAPQTGHPFSSLKTMCGEWADSLELAHASDNADLDAGLAREAIETLRTLPGSATTEVLLCTDLHAGNVLAARREPWLMIDPKPLLGDPAFDPIQHMLNCDARLIADPSGLANRMAGLLDLDPQRVRMWLFARCAQESLNDPTMRQLARRLAP